MEEHAWGLAHALHAREAVVVHTATPPEPAPPPAPFAVRHGLARRLTRDRPVLEAAAVDAWLCLDSGYAAYAPTSRVPFFVYAHGADFLHPWVAAEERLERVALGLVHRAPGQRERAERWRHRLRRRRLAAGLRASRTIFANSEFTAARLREVFPAVTTPVVVNTPGIDECYFTTPRPPRSGSGDVFRLLTVARLSRGSRRKNVDGLLRAVARLEAPPRVTLEIVGDGDWRDELEAMAAELGITEHVTFLGATTPAALIAAYDRADLMVLAGRVLEDSYEGFGIVYAEAAARGVPALASRAGGATDAVVDGRTGVVIDGAEPDDIAAGIRRAIALRDDIDPEDVRAFAARFRWSGLAGALHAAMAQAR
jgi:glycosyltransferase involved in cell wall biosynthesis